jgi:hypothetical protein
VDKEWLKVLSALSSIQIDYPQSFGQKFTDQDVAAIIEILRGIAGAVDKTLDGRDFAWSALQRRVATPIYMRINAIRPKIELLPGVETTELMNKFHEVQEKFAEAIQDIKSDRRPNFGSDESRILYGAAKRYLQHVERETALQEWQHGEWHIDGQSSRV